jgi:putative solute:sodium symporter small subunit
MSLNHTRRLEAEKRRYWQANLTITLALLVLWALVGPIAGVVFARELNAFSLGGFPLGFWMAQQGATIAFVVIILVYALLLGRLDAGHRRRLSQIEREGGAA